MHCKNNIYIYILIIRILSHTKTGANRPQSRGPVCDLVEQELPATAGHVDIHLSVKVSIFLIIS